MSEIYSAIDVMNLSVFLVFVSHQICAFSPFDSPFQMGQTTVSPHKNLFMRRKKIFLLTHVKYKNLLLYLI